MWELKKGGGETLARLASSAGYCAALVGDCRKAK